MKPTLKPIPSPIPKPIPSPIVKALNGLPVYYRYHIKNGLALGKGLKTVRYQDFTKKRNQSQKRKREKTQRD